MPNWRSEEELKNWLVVVLNGAWLSAVTHVSDLGRVRILGVNGNGEPGSTRRLGVQRFDGRTVYPDIVGFVQTPDGNTRPFYVEVHYSKTRLGDNTDTLLQALQYKGADLFERWPHPIVVITDDVFLSPLYRKHNRHWLLERMAWRLGLAVLRYSGGSGLLLTMSEQHKWRVAKP